MQIITVSLGETRKQITRGSYVTLLTWASFLNYKQLKQDSYISDTFVQKKN